MEDKSKLKLIYEDGKPVMKMESDGVRMTFRFAEQEPETDVKENIVSPHYDEYMKYSKKARAIYGRYTVHGFGSLRPTTLRENDLQSKRGFLQPL